MLEGISGAAILGAMIFLLGEQTILTRALCGALIGAGAFVAIPAGVSWALDQIRPVRLTVGCTASVLPTKIPEGGLVIVHLYPGAGGSSISTGEAGSATGWSGNEAAYRCEVRNQSGKELPAIIVTLPITYAAIEGRAIDEAKLNGSISVVAPFLDARPERPFAFYVMNPQEFNASISTIHVRYARSSSRNRAIETINNIVHPVTFGPK